MLSNPYRELQKKLIQLEEEKRDELLAAMSNVKVSVQPEEKKTSDKAPAPKVTQMPQVIKQTAFTKSEVKAETAVCSGFGSTPS